MRYPDCRIKPTATAGAAFIPFECPTFAADIDLIESETVLSTCHSQYLRFGAEWKFLHFLALRGGLGLDFWAVRLDLAGAMALKTTAYDGSAVPREARLGLQQAADF